MESYQKFFDYCIHDNKLIPYWSGVNVSRLATKPIIDYKEYYQFRYPLFSEDLLHDVEIRKLNNKLLIDIGQWANVDVRTLLDTDEFTFLSITKKPISSYRSRVGFEIKINNHECKNAFNKVKNFLASQLKISSVILDNLDKAANQIFTENDFVTFPISLMGIGKHSEEEIPYAQLYITNNPNTTSGNVNRISEESALHNAINIIKMMSIDMDLCKLKDLIEFAYSRGAFLCFYGIDIHINEIKKFKLYFRFKNVLSTNEVVTIFSKKIHGLNTMSILNADHIADFIAFTFVPTENNKFIFDGVQIYQR